MITFYHNCVLQIYSSLFFNSSKVALFSITKVLSLQDTSFKAVSENSQVAGENLQFVRDETLRLGLSYKEAAKGFSQMLASNQGQMQLNEVKELFIGMSEAGTLLGLSADDQAGSLRALQQMLSKTKVSAKLFGHLYGNIYLQPL